MMSSFRVTSALVISKRRTVYNVLLYHHHPHLHPFLQPSFRKAAGLRYAARFALRSPRFAARAKMASRRGAIRDTR